MHNNYNTEPPHRRGALQALAGATAVAGIIFFVLNSFRGVYLLAYLELFASLGAMYVIYQSRITDNIDRWIAIFIAPFYLIFVLALALPGTSPTVFVWTFLIPLISYVLLGSHRGFWVTVILETLSLFIFYWRFGLVAEQIKPVEMINFMVSAAASWSFSHVYEKNRERSQRQLERMAATDSLTQLYNRALMTDIYEREVEFARRQGQAFSLLLCDLDHFKSFNDGYGHELGDKVLVYVANILKQHVRASDYVFRIGGEEFCVMLPGATLSQAQSVAGQLHQVLKESPLEYEEQQLGITMSIGIGQWRPSVESFKDLYEAADQALYEAKRRGRNQSYSAPVASR